MTLFRASPAVLNVWGRRAKPNVGVRYTDQDASTSMRRDSPHVAGSFSFFPGPDTDPSNPQKVDQYISVKIEFTSTDGIPVTPGMSVTVHIHKQ
jgi:hypothetical protein